MYTILYIDEDITDVHRFERVLEGEFEIRPINFEDINFSDLMNELENRDFDYLIVDYDLNEKSNCGFNGDEVVKSFSKKFPHFPVILLTNFDARAISEVTDFDLEKIHSKTDYEDDKKQSFIKRIHKQIETYIKNKEDGEIRLKNLINKKESSNNLNAAEEEELMKLDVFLEEVLGGELVKIPEIIRHPSNDTKIVQLLEKTDILITKLQQYETV